MLSEAASRTASTAVSRSVSEGQSSASGVSDVSDGLDIPIGDRSTSTPIDRAVYNRPSQNRPAASGPSAPLSSIALEAASATCSMCEVATSHYLCTQCGRLSFCAACCVSLHDNKFLANHALVSLEPQKEGQVVPLSRLKESLAASSKPATAPVTVPIAHTLAEKAPQEGKTSTVTDESKPEAAELEAVDVAVLAADRNIVQARLSEISACRGLLQTVSDGLSKERFRCKDITQTAADAIHQRFDVLRRVLQEKEAEFVACVEQAGKQRLEDATKHSFHAVTTLTECDAFLEQMRLQLDRVSANKRLFAEARTAMLAATENKLKSLDESIQQLQHELDKILAQTLGVSIPLDPTIEELKRIKPPQRLAAANIATVHVNAIPAEKFVDSPTVRVVRQKTSAEPQSAAGAPSATAPTHRKLYHQELEALRNTPLRDLRASAAPPAEGSKLIDTSQHASTAATFVDPVAAVPHAAAATVSSISKIAQKFHSIGTPLSLSTNSSSRISGTVPKELEKLRSIVASTTQSIQRRGSAVASASAVSSSFMMGGAGRARSPMIRTDSPSRSSVAQLSLRTSSPIRNTQLTPYRHSISPSRVNPDATPGPGAYYKPADFTSKSMLSTPPRRR